MKIFRLIIFTLYVIPATVIDLYPQNNIVFRIYGGIYLSEDRIKNFMPADLLTKDYAPYNAEVIIYSYTPLIERISYSGGNSRETITDNASIKALVKITKNSRLHETCFIVSDGKEENELLKKFADDLKSCLKKLK